MLKYNILDYHCKALFETLCIFYAACCGKPQEFGGVGEEVYLGGVKRN
jgi:hypothetical protein